MRVYVNYFSFSFFILYSTNKTIFYNFISSPLLPLQNIFLTVNFVPCFLFLSFSVSCSSYTSSTRIFSFYSLEITHVNILKISSCALCSCVLIFFFSPLKLHIPFSLVLNPCLQSFCINNQNYVFPQIFFPVCVTVNLYICFYNFFLFYN